MLHTINGLPAHVLLIHLVVILIPLGAFFTVLSALWPAAHARLGFITPLTCLIALVLVPITTSAGEWLKSRQNFSGELEQRIQHHANLAAGFAWYALGLFVVSAAVWWFGRGTGLRFRPVPAESDDRTEPADGGTATTMTVQPRAATASSSLTLPQWAAVTLAAAAVVVSALVTFQLYRIGDAGAHAVWQGSVSSG
ncbi:MAG TPA: hypothetical protein VGH43_07870 [Jatrophihabitans sp.]|jgi:hypothetical protein